LEPGKIQEKRATGIEPAWPAWKAGTLPLSYARAAKAKVARRRAAAKCFLEPRFDLILLRIMIIFLILISPAWSLKHLLF
jgi:hypothetical protein